MYGMHCLSDIAVGYGWLADGVLCALHGSIRMLNEKCVATAGSIHVNSCAAAGSIILSLGAISERDASVAGDLAALCAALAMIGYLLVGRKLRQWMPIFVYAFPVTACAALLLSLAALAVGSGGGIGGGGDSGGGGDGGDEFDSGGGDFGGSGGGAASGNTGHGRIVGDDRHGVVGWVASGRYAPLVLYLAVGPGIVGHTGARLAALLEHVLMHILMHDSHVVILKHILMHCGLKHALSAGVSGQTHAPSHNGATAVPRLHIAHCLACCYAQRWTR